ncbi:MAG TPA: YbjN domain-containing protein [Chroococcidiopsis sp.]
MSVEDLNRFLTAVLDSEPLRLRLIHECGNRDRLQYIVKLAQEQRFSITPEDVIALIAPDETSTNGELEVFELGGKLRLTWYPNNGGEQTVEFGRVNDYANIFQSGDRPSEPLNPDEAVLAVGFLAMVIDGERTPEEMLILDDFLKHMGLAKDANQDVRRKIQRLYHQEGPGALFNAAKAAMSPAYAETAFALATRIVLADDQILDEENDCLIALAQALSMPDDRVQQIISDVIVQHSAERLANAPTGQIFDSLVSFFAAEGWTVELVQGEPTLTMGYAANTCTLTCFATARESEQQLIVYSLAPVKIPPNQRGAAAELLTRINYGLTIGNFEMDCDSGEVRFRTSLDTGGEFLSANLIRQLVYTNVFTMERYLPGLEAILAEVSPTEAIAQIETDQ